MNYIVTRKTKDEYGHKDKEEHLVDYPDFETLIADLEEGYITSFSVRLAPVPKSDRQPRQPRHQRFDENMLDYDIE